MNETLHKIAEHFPVVVQEVDMDFPQHTVYVDSINRHLPHTDWMAFIDGDEFLFPTQHAHIKDALAEFEDKPISALTVYWTCYGSSGHLADPKGLIFEEFTRHSASDFPPNRYIKSIVRGKHRAQVSGVSAHYFATDLGAFDEKLRPIFSHELVGEGAPSQEKFRINHYMTQSYDFYRSKKSQMIPADGNLGSIRSLEVFDGLDRNECDDGIRYKFLIKQNSKCKKLKKKLQQALKSSSN